MGGIRWFSAAFPGARLDFCPLFFTVPCYPAPEQQLPLCVSSKSLVSAFCCGSLPSSLATPPQHCHSVAAVGISLLGWTQMCIWQPVLLEGPLCL